MKAKLEALIKQRAERKFSLPISPGFDHIILGRRQDYLAGAHSLLPLVLELREALEKDYYHYGSDYAANALASFDKYVGGA